MASSAFDTYGTIHCNKVFMSEGGVRFHNDDDDTKYVELKCTDPTGQHSHVFPNTSGTILNSESAVAGAKVNITGAAYGYE